MDSGELVCFSWRLLLGDSESWNSLKEERIIESVELDVPPWASDSHSSDEDDVCAQGIGLTLSRDTKA